MNSRDTVLAAALMLSAAASQAPAGTQIIRPDNPEDAGVRLVAKEFYDRIADGDAKGAKALFDGPEDQAALLESNLRFVTAFRRMQATLAAKFGDKAPTGPGLGPALLSSRAASVANELITLNGDAASIEVNSPLNVGTDLHRVSGKWKVTHLTAVRSQTPAIGKFLDTLASSADSVRNSVETGDITTSNRAQRELKQRLRPALRELYNPRPDVSAAPATRPSSRPARSNDALIAGAADLQHLLGEKLDASNIVKLLDSLPGAPHVGEFEERSVLSLSSPEAGIEFLFSLPDGRLSQIVVYAEGCSGFSQYGGEFPRGLSLRDVRREVERKLGSPAESGGGWGSRYTVSYPDAGIQIAYQADRVADPDNPVSSIHLTSPKPASHVPATQPATPASPRLTFRFVVPDAKADDPAVEWLPLLDKPEPARLPVSRRVLLDESDVTELADLLNAPDSHKGIDITLTSGGARRLEEATTTHQKSRLAIVLDGQVVVAPEINAPIKRGSMLLDLGALFTDEQSGHIFGRLHAAVTALSAAPAGPVIREE